MNKPHNNAGLTTLHLTRQKIGDEGAIQLAEALKMSTTLTTLELFFNRIGAGGAKELAEALKMNMVTTLDLSNSLIGAEEAKSCQTRSQ